MIIMIFDAYIINLKKDIGRKYSCNEFINIFQAKIWYGIDANEIKNNKVSKWATKTSATESAKKTKKDILQFFYDNSEKEYLLILEDDIFLHKDFLEKNNIDFFFNKLNYFLLNNDISLLYLGTSRHIIPNENSLKNLKFKSFNNYFNNFPEKCTGAYSFIINKKHINDLIIRIHNETLYGQPFDLSCLGYISNKYPNKTYFTDPHIFVPDISISNIRNPTNQIIFWNNLNINKSNYIINKLGVISIWINYNYKINLIELQKYLQIFQPIYDIYFFSNFLNDELKKLYNIIKIEYCDYEDNIFFNKLKKYKKIIKIKLNFNINYFNDESLLFSINNV